MQIIKLSVKDKIQLKKSHPCGNDLFEILRVGSVVRVVCLGCKRDMEIDRIKLEKSIKKVLQSEEKSV